MNEEQNPRNNPPVANQPVPARKGFNVWYLLIGVVVIYLLFSMVSGGSKVPVVSRTEFMQLVGAENNTTGNGYEFSDAKETQILAVYQQGNNFYFAKKSADKANILVIDDFNANPKKNADGVVYANDYYAITDLIDAQNRWANAANESITDPAQKKTVIKMTTVPVAGNFWDIAIPIISLLGMLLLIFFIWRGFSGRGSGISNMGRNRATVVMNSPVRFADVAGIDEEKEQVSELVDFLKNPKKYLDLGARIPKGCLLVGQPGTGKTLLAKAIAGEAGVPFFSVSGSDFSEMLVGVGPSRMRDLFKDAKAAAPCIIFIDEIDSIARMRGVGSSGVSEENEQTLNQLLVQMDGFTKSEGVIVLAATNRPDVLDQALLRPGRFDRQIIVQIPDVKGREQILKVHAKNKPLADGVDLKRVAGITSGFTGADIENLLNESAILSATKGHAKITMQDILEGINKVLLGPQKKSRIITEDDKRITAYHEAGHAVVARLLQDDRTVQEVSIIPRGMAAGYTLTNDNEDKTKHQTKSALEARLAMMLGGRAAEEIFIGDITSGASNDIKVATNLASKMVKAWGMSEKLGPLYYDAEEEVALRLYNDNHMSESLQSVIDAEIKALITTAHGTAHKIVKDKKAAIEVMVEVLLECETIYAADIDNILGGKNKDEVLRLMNERAAADKKQEDADKLAKILETIDAEEKQRNEMADMFLESGLITQDKKDKLKSNFEVARKFAREFGELPRISPNLDNLESYAETLYPKKKEKAPTAEKPAKKPRAKKETKDGTK
ncbi:MAG: ATP-dependent zinc metalloprotease FtsH [Christensenellaceae bacterium]|nr:ATP-dependent zinc metalloprotease FtsH [Christensenellaceae bacterium]